MARSEPGSLEDAKAMASDVAPARWRCRECGKPHARDDPPCDNCGYRQFEQAVVRESERTATTVEYQCVGCGTRHIKNSPPCKRCGDMRLKAVEFEYQEETRPTSSDLGSRAYRPLVAVTFAIPLFWAAITVGMQVVPPSLLPSVFREIVYVALVPILVSLVVVPALLYFDARAVRSADLSWNPHPAGYAVAAAVATPLLFAPVPFVRSTAIMSVVEFPFESLGVASNYLTLAPPIVALAYLSHRHYFVRDSVDQNRWWLALPAIVAVGLGAVAVMALAPALSAPVLGVARLASLVFPIAAYLDAAHVRAVADDWDPNPVVHFGLALVSVLAFPGTLLYVGYTGFYLYRRHQHVGLPLVDQ